MSTPTPPNSKLDGLELYAPRWARTASAPSNEDLSPEELPPESAEDPPPQQNSDQQTETESLEAAQARLEEAIRAAIDISYSSAGIVPPVAAATLPRAANLVLPQADAVNEPPLAPDWLTRARYGSPSAPLLDSRLAPDIVPEPPNDPEARSVIPTLFRLSLMVGFAALVAYGLTMMSWSQPDAGWPRRAKSDVAAVAGIAPAKTKTIAIPPPRLVVGDDQLAFANEPLPLGVSVDHAADDESLQLDGLATGTRVSAGVATSLSRWQIPLHELDHLYLYAPTDFVGVMNTAVDLLSANKKLLDSRAVRLEWRAKKPDSVELVPAVPDNPPRAAIQTINSDEATTLMKRGQDFLQIGDISAARIVFQRLADAGVADGALAAATTYDPRYLAAHKVIGVRGDGAKAHALYQRAAQLGSTEAGRQLAGADGK
jgi:hypothetical protein